MKNISANSEIRFNTVKKAHTFFTVFFIDQHVRWDCYV